MVVLDPVRSGAALPLALSNLVLDQNGRDLAGECEGATRLLGLGVASFAIGAPHEHVRRDGWVGVGGTVEADVVPAQCAYLLSTGAGEERHDDVRVHAVAGGRGEDRFRLGQRERLGRAAGAALRSLRQLHHVPFDQAMNHRAADRARQAAAHFAEAGRGKDLGATSKPLVNLLHCEALQLLPADDR